jgi:hypothetical protein
LALAVVCLAVAAVPAARGMDLSDQLQQFAFLDRGNDRPRLRLAFVDCAALPADMLAAVQAETTALVGAMGVSAEIRTLPEGSDLDPDAVTLIVVDVPAPRNLTRDVMGAVQRQGVIPALWIYPANVAGGTGLGWRGRSRWSAGDRHAFATAMARVAVHEIVHLVCPWREHDETGLMAGVLGRETLTGPRLPFTRELRRDFTLGVDALAGASFPLARSGAEPRR